MQTPIIYIFFNRPEVTRRTFAAVRAQRPRQLYLIADGPRANRPADAECCREARAIVEAMLDWPCEVIRNYSETNLGAGRRIASGLTAAFSDHFEEAIILEDDILPHPDFFAFCTTMLERHRHDPRIHAVSGFNPLERYRPAHGAGVPTQFNDSWGWATWRRAWTGYRFDISEWRMPGVRETMQEKAGNPLIFQHYARGFDEVLDQRVDTWDYQWTYMMLREGRHAIASSVNFISSLGFSQLATHTHVAPDWYAGLDALAAVSARSERDYSRPDPLHDRLYAQVIMSASPSRIRLARSIARYPWLTPLLHL